LTRPIQQHDRVILVTLHCTVHIYDFVQNDPSPSAGASFSGLLYPTRTIHAPQRPLLWAARFSRPAYSSSAPRAASESNAEYIRIAGGSMWGDTFVWDVSTAADLLGTACQDASSAREPIRGSLRRLVGHKVRVPLPLRFCSPSRIAAQERLTRRDLSQGAVFSASFSDSSEYLATCSDDRTIRVWDLRQLDPDFDPSSASGSSALPGINPSAAPHQTLWGHEGRVWRTLFLDSEEATSTVPSSPSRAEERPPALVSIGEDATCRLWRGGDVIKTWRDGHDGRSIWSIAVARLEGDEPTSPERRYVLTGGADGAVRCWPLDPPECTTPPTATPSTSGTRQDQKTPRSKTSKVTALRVVNLPSAAEGLCTETTRQLAVTLSGDG
jgi:WD40 repeat protein